jgi:hypothetical protein
MLKFYCNPHPIRTHFPRFARGALMRLFLRLFSWKIPPFAPGAKGVLFDKLPSLNIGPGSHRSPILPLFVVVKWLGYQKVGGRVHSEKFCFFFSP